MKHSQRIFALLFAVLLLLSLCACKKNDPENNASTEPEIVIPSSIYGIWYPHPEVDDIPIEIHEDGTFTRDGKKLTWTADTITEDEIVLTALDGDEEFTLKFSQLNFPVPLLSVTTYGVFIQQADLWKYMIEWYNPDTGKAFSLSFYELAQNNCNLIINGNDLKIEVRSGNAVTHTIELSGELAIVTDAQGNSTEYKPMN